MPAKESQADIACPSGASVSIAYECDTIPEDSPSGAWEVQVRHPASWWSDGEYLHLDAFDPLGEVIFYRVEESLATSMRYEIETNIAVSRYLPPPDNPTVGVGISDGTGSHDPDGDTLSFYWRQVSGPRASLDDPRAARPRFVVPQSVDLSALVFSLSVSDGRLESEPDSTTVLVHASSPDEGTGSLLSEVQNSSINAARKRRLSRLLQNAMNTNDCNRKLALVEQFAAEVERGRGSWLDATTADAWLERARDLADEIGPCARSCREEGGIEGSNLSLEGAIAWASGGEAPPPDAPWSSVEYSAQKAIDGEAESVWTAPGVGNELVIDLESLGRHGHE